MIGMIPEEPSVNDLLSDYAYRLRQLLFSSQTEAAKYLNLHRTTVARYETGSVTPPLGYLATLMVLATQHPSLEGESKGHKEALRNQLEIVRRRYYWESRVPPIQDWADVESHSKQWRSGMTNSSDVRQPGPYLLPPLPAHGVVGRNHELAEMRSLLMLSDPYALEVPPVALLGMGGVGKTTLAIALGREAGIQERFPDGILWASLGPSPDIRSHMVRWGDALGVELRTNKDIFECKVQLQGTLFRRRTLLIVDDVWSVTDGSYFMIGGPKCRTLLTTRESPVAHGLATRSRSLQIGAVDQESALTLLRRLVPEAAWTSTLDMERLCQKLECLPLAITLAGRLLASEADVPSRMRKLVEELTEHEKVRLDLVQSEGRIGLVEDAPISLRAILGISVNRLEPEDQERFAMLAVFGGEPLTFDVAAVAAVWQCTKEEAEASLSRLIQHGLVQRQTDARFLLPALLADYATELMTKKGS